MFEVDRFIEAQALRIRSEVKSAWSSRTIHPQYVWDPQNRSKGQCGLTSLSYCHDLTIQADNAARQVAAIQAGKVTMQPAGIRINIADCLAGTGNTLLDNYVQKVVRVARLVLMYEYGYAIDENTGAKLDDHCWARAVEIEQARDPFAGTHVDTTLDQFGRDLYPEVLVQPADPTNSRITYHPLSSSLFRLHSGIASS